MIRTSGHKIGAVGAERAVPDPSLVRLERCFQRKGSRLALYREILIPFDVVRGGRVDGPDSRVMIGRAGCQMANVGTEEDARYVGGVGLERSYRDQRRYVAVLNHPPYVDVPLADRK